MLDASLSIQSRICLHSIAQFLRCVRTGIGLQCTRAAPVALRPVGKVRHPRHRASATSDPARPVEGAPWAELGVSPCRLPERKKLAQFFLFLVLTRSHFFLVFVSDCALEDFSQ